MIQAIFRKSIEENIVEQVSGERGYSKKKKRKKREQERCCKKRSRVNGTRNRRKQRLPGIMQGKRCQKYIPFPVGIRCLYVQELTHRGWECRSWIGEIQKVEKGRKGRVSRGRERVAKEHEKGEGWMENWGEIGGG